MPFTALMVLTSTIWHVEYILSLNIRNNIFYPCMILLQLPRVQFQTFQQLCWPQRFGLPLRLLEPHWQRIGWISCCLAWSQAQWSNSQHLFQLLWCTCTPLENNLIVWSCFSWRAIARVGCCSSVILRPVCWWTNLFCPKQKSFIQVSLSVSCLLMSLLKQQFSFEL